MAEGIRTAKRAAKKAKEKKLSAFEIEFANIEMEGREVLAQELSDKLGNDLQNASFMAGRQQ